MIAPYDEYPVDYTVCRVDIAEQSVTFWLQWSDKAPRPVDYVKVSFEQIEAAAGLPAEWAIMDLDFYEGEFRTKLENKDEQVKFIDIHIDSLHKLLP